jgi:hypothetical protein
MARGLFYFVLDVILLFLILSEEIQQLIGELMIFPTKEEVVIQMVKIGKYERFICFFFVCLFVPTPCGEWASSSIIDISLLIGYSFYP